jgi:xanthine dehydrogenase accessory factor
MNPMADWLAKAIELTDRDEPSILVTIAAAAGSSPREAGCRMLVHGQGVAGTIGGGHLELKAIERARAMLAAPDSPRLDELSLSLGPSLGQCCGGRVTLTLERLDRTALTRLERMEVPAETVFLFGAGHVGRALVHALALLPYRIHWFDGRSEMFPAELPGNVQVENSAEPRHDVASAPAGAFFIVMTHSHALDLDICDRVLARGDFAFLGLIGSASKRATFLGRLRRRGHSQAALARLTCPIGLPQVPGKQPATIAIAVAGQLLALSAAKTRQRRDAPVSFDGAQGR